MAGVTIGDLEALARGKLAGLSKEAEDAADISEKWDGAHAENVLFDKRRAALANIARLADAQEALLAGETEAERRMRDNQIVAWAETARKQRERLGADKYAERVQGSDKMHWGWKP